MEGKYILTHDLGTSGNKAVLFNLNLDVISQINIIQNPDGRNKIQKIIGMQ